MNNWENILNKERNKTYFNEILTKVSLDRLSKTIYPKEQDVFKALELTPLENVKVVLLGQDPYHEENQAMGLAFSVPNGIDIPPSLKNIFIELHNDLGLDIPKSGDLTAWAKEGVLLLNSILTVEEGCALSHAKYGWEKFTDELIKAVNDKAEPVVFILLGNAARSKKVLITNHIHKVIENVHPSPLSVYRGFFGSKIFSKTNEFLQQNNIKPINWNSINE